MCASRNAESIKAGQQFGASKPRDEPMFTGGHAPGVKASRNDGVPEFSAKVLPAGSAPADKTYLPNTENEILGQGDNSLGTQGEEDTYTKALDMPGATSADVHTGIGKPIQGQTAGDNLRKKQGNFIYKMGHGVNQVDERLNPSQRGLEREDVGVRSGNMDATPAEDKLPQSAEAVASERA